MALNHALSTNNYGPAKLIVATSAANGTHTTLAAAMSDASVGDTIFLRDSVTENVTITPGVNISAWTGGSLNTPSITGKLTMTGAGTSNISGITLITNSDFCIAVTGSAASILNLENCYINCSNNTGISYTSSNANSQININYCVGNIGTTGITYFSHSGAGTLVFLFSRMRNSGSSVTNSTVSGSGLLNYYNSVISFCTTTSSTSSISCFYSSITSVNATALTIGGSGSNNAASISISSGSASAISISSSFGLYLSIISSSNTNSITGAGSLLYSGLTLSTSTKINTTTQIGGTLQGGVAQDPSAGWLGEQIRAVAASGAVTLSNITAANVTSISLTAGVWDVSALIYFDAAAITGTAFAGSISLVSATRGTARDAEALTPIAPTATAANTVAVPSYRVTITTTTTVYMIAYAAFTVGTLTASGRISATRVG